MQYREFFGSNFFSALLCSHGFTVQTTARKNPERGNSDPVISSSLYTKVYFDEFFRPGKKIIKRRGTYLKIELDA